METKSRRNGALKELAQEMHHKRSRRKSRRTLHSRTPRGAAPYSPTALRGAGGDSR